MESRNGDLNLTIEEFLFELKKCAKHFRWYIIRGGEIRAKKKTNALTRFFMGEALYCPIEAVATNMFHQKFAHKFLEAGRLLGMSENLICYTALAADGQNKELEEKIFTAIYEGIL